MKLNYNLLLKFLVPGLVLLSACSEDDPLPEPLPVDIQADNKWNEGEISTDQVKWFKVHGEESFATMFIEWAEEGFHGESRSYNADIKVSAYKLDGSTPYFENKNNGYGSSARSIEVQDEFQVLLKVELNDPSKPGTFALRSTGISSAGDIKYEELAVTDVWTDASIADGETKGYIVDCKDHSKVVILWAESDSPESGYTAEIKGSVFKLDGETPYADLTNGKDILNKNKSHTNDPKSVEVDPAEKKIKIHIMVNSAPGTYAIKVIPVS